MRTVTENLLKRLTLQADEAKLLGMTKLASLLNEKVLQNVDNTRTGNDFYSYSADELVFDIEANLWNAIIRIADFYNVGCLDAAEIDKIITKTAEDLIIELRASVGLEHDIGAYEPTVPGEDKRHVILEIDE